MSLQQIISLQRQLEKLRELVESQDKRIAELESRPRPGRPKKDNGKETD